MEPRKQIQAVNGTYIIKNKLGEGRFAKLAIFFFLLTSKCSTMWVLRNWGELRS